MSITHTPNINADNYQKRYQQSITNPEQFWSEQASAFITWQQPFENAINHSQTDFSEGNVQWFDHGTLNVSVNCIDRHLPEKAKDCAFIWEADEPGQSQQISYQQLSDSVNRLANLLKDKDINKGDRVCIYMPMIIEAIYAMLACARIGAVHSVVFGGFSSEALKDRINDSACSMVITANQGVRGGRTVPLKDNVDKIIEQCPTINHVLVVQHTDADIAWNAIDVDYRHLINDYSTYCEPEWVNAEDPLFILYTSGSTGKPKGVLHSSAGYLLQSMMSFHYTFDYQQGDVFWCTADIGWITGHSYMVYGPLAAGAKSLIFEGVPTYPNASRCWQIIDEHRVTQFYTAPTAIRALMAQGDSFVNVSSRESLRLLGTVGEPINPEAWQWYSNVIGRDQCPIVDTWWQTETGAHMITPLPYAINTKPSSACLPFFGVVPALLDDNGNEIEGEGQGALVIKQSWPSQIRTVYGDHQRLFDTYFSTYKGYYFTGDGARRDADGYYWITGRMDDVLNISGHRMGTAEIESALVLHPSVAEAAIVGYPHDIKGQGIYAFVTLMNGEQGSEELRQALLTLCTSEIGAIAKPDIIQFTSGLPKTRSGKIMRRILRKIAENELSHLGDISTLADPSVVDAIINDAKQLN